MPTHLGLLLLAMLLPAAASTGGPMVQPGTAIQSHSNPSGDNGNGTLALVLTDGSEHYGLSNFHVLYRTALMYGWCGVLRHQVNGTPKISASWDGATVRVGDRTKQWFSPGQFRCFPRKRKRGPDAAIFRLDETVAWSNQVLGCERLRVEGTVPVKTIEQALAKEEPVLVAKSGKVSGLTFALVDKAYPSAFTGAGTYHELKLRKLEPEEFAAFPDRHVAPRKTTNIPKCPSDYASCGGDSGALWFAWPTAEAWETDAPFIDVQAVAVHHSGGGGIATAFVLDDFLNNNRDLSIATGGAVAPPTTEPTRHHPNPVFHATHCTPR